MLGHLKAIAEIAVFLFFVGAAGYLLFAVVIGCAIDLLDWWRDKH